MDGELFQSTLSVRRATRRHRRPHGQKHISIHALRKESDVEHVVFRFRPLISIHALRKESDQPCRKPH